MICSKFYGIMIIQKKERYINMNYSYEINFSTRGAAGHGIQTDIKITGLTESRAKVIAAMGKKAQNKLIFTGTVAAIAVMVFFIIYRNWITF